MSKTIIIIGAGLAGLSAALQAENGCNVKTGFLLPSERHSLLWRGGRYQRKILNTKDENDSPEEYFCRYIKARWSGRSKCSLE